MVTINLFMGEQDGLVFEFESAPPLLWVDSYETQKIKKDAKNFGLEVGDDADLPRLPYVLVSTEKEDGVPVSARYDFCADLMNMEPATEEDESSQ